MVKRDEGTADAQVVRDEAMALREEDEYAAEVQIGEEDTLTDTDERARAMWVLGFPSTYDH